MGEMVGRLFVYVPGLTEKPAKARSFAARLAEDPAWNSSTFYAWPAGIGVWTRRTFEDAAEALATFIDARWDGSSEIVLMGHSMGGLVVRRSYLQAVGAYGNTWPWGERVTRIVLFATPNRGFGKDKLPLTWRLALRFIATPLHLSVLQIRAGSAFISDLRIQWIRTMAEREAQHTAPYVVQLLGDQDSLVSHEDSLDVEQMRSAAQKGVANANHATIADFQGADGEERYTTVRKALFDRPAATTPKEALSAAETVRPVVFLLHGIRAGTDDWVARAKTVLNARAENPVVREPSYGYFSAWNFGFPFLRASNRRFMLDAYTQELALRPHASIHFIGHSNGTYILGQALTDVPAVHFDHVFLAGSVLPRNYDWRERAKRHQVTQLRNDQATHDVPVGVLCNLLRGMRSHDVGTGGFDGFLESFDEMHAVKYHPGGHAAALTDTNLRDATDFTLTGTLTPPTDLVPTPSKTFAIISRLCQFLPLMLLLSAAATALWVVSVPTWTRIAVTILAGAAVLRGIAKSA